jgi:hypothetical protein
VLALVGLFLISGPAGAAEWKVGLAEVKITPERPVVMAGYDGRTKPFEKVADDLYVKAMALEDRNGNRAVLVTSDLIGIDGSFADQICEQLRGSTGLRREQVLLNSSHTHAGPLLRLTPPTRGAISAGDGQRTVEYTRALQKKIVDTIGKATQSLQPAQLSWASGVADFGMNRREFTPTGVILGVNPRGLVDRTVPVLRVDDANGKMRAVLFGAAIHGTTLTGKNFELCGDYAGFAQGYVQRQHPTVQAMFMLGCAGDVNPYPRGAMDVARQHGESLGKEVCRVLGTQFQPVRGPLTVALDQAVLPLQDPPSRSELEALVKEKSDRASKARRMLEVLDRGDKIPMQYSCPFAVWQFGQDLTLVGLPGEVVTDYVPMLEKTIGPNRLWLAAYCNDVFGYLPSARVLEEGGYEAMSSGRPNLFSPKAQDAVVAKVRELAQKVGRELPTKR